MANKIVSFLQGIAHWFKSSAGQAAIRQVEQAAIDAEPIVAGIALLVPNRNFQAIAAAYSKWAIPFLKTEVQLSDPGAQGVALRDLAVAVLRAKYPQQPPNILHAAIELALAHVTTQ